MIVRCLAHLPDPVLLHDLDVLLANERATTATVLLYLAEVDVRRLHLAQGYDSMYAFCIHRLCFSEDAASKRIQACRAARRFPAIFDAVADARLHLSGVCLLAPHLTPENADELMAAAAGQTKAQIEELLAQRFPRTEALALVEALPASPPPVPGEAPEPAPIGESPREHAPGHVPPRAGVAPVAPERFALHVTIGRSTQEKLRYAQDLLGHALPSGDLAAVLDRALDALIEKLERRKLGATGRPRRSRRPSSNPRHIPAQVKRAVWERDGGRCTFVSDSGHRCAARKLLEFDHAQPVARGGRATVENLRLRCRAHNQHAAEQAFGAEFMRRKREEARRAAAERKRAADELITPLRMLGFRADEARAAAERCDAMPNASLEERLRAALSFLAKPCQGRAVRVHAMPA